MKEIYEYLLKNSTFDNLIKNYIQGNRIAIIRNNEKSGVNTVNLHDRIIIKPNFFNKKVAKIN